MSFPTVSTILISLRPSPNHPTARSSIMQPIPSYAVFDDDTPKRSLRMWNCSQGLFPALENVRVVRNYIINPYAGDTFAVDRILPTDPAYPFCNRIGQLCSDPRNHWGYRFAHGGRDVSVWIEQMPATPGGAIVGSVRADLADPRMRWAVQRTTVG
jgi:hypothetical protein